MKSKIKTSFNLKLGLCLRALCAVFYAKAYILELAGGAASTGRGRVLEVKPESIHERCPIHLGSTEDVAEIEAVYRQLEA